MHVRVFCASMFCLLRGAGAEARAEARAGARGRSVVSEYATCWGGPRRGGSTRQFDSGVRVGYGRWLARCPLLAPSLSCPLPHRAVKRSGVRGLRARHGDLYHSAARLLPMKPSVRATWNEGTGVLLRECCVRTSLFYSITESRRSRLCVYVGVRRAASLGRW